MQNLDLLAVEEAGRLRKNFEKIVLTLGDNTDINSTLASIFSQTAFVQKNGRDAKIFPAHERFEQGGKLHFSPSPTVAGRHVTDLDASWAHRHGQSSAGLGFKHAALAAK